MPYSRGECGDFASVQQKGDCEQSIVHSIDGGINQFKTACREFRTNRKVDIFNFALCF